MSHLTSKFRSTPTITFKGRHQQTIQNKRLQAQPSPQLYNIDHFSIAKNIKQSVKFTKQNRTPTFNHSKTLPGPGTYEAITPKELRSFHKGDVLKKGPKRFQEEERGESPAPGHYKIAEKKYSSPMFSIGKVQRSLKELTGLSSGPSPDIYNPNYKSQQKSVTVQEEFYQRSFTHSQRKNVTKAGQPGPGAYETEKPFLSTSFNQKKEVLSRARRHSEALLGDLPGRTIWDNAAGSYRSPSLFNEDRIKRIGYTWKKEVRSLSSAKDYTPGPGQYQASTHLLRFKRHQGVSMAKSERMFMKRSMSSPGPGDHESYYEGQSKFKTISTSKFAKSKAPRFSQPKENNLDFINPEKLNYRKGSVPSFSISQTRKKPLFQEELKKGSPDKFYDSNVLKLRRSESGFHFPRAVSMKEVKKSDVGPGYYNSQEGFVPKKKKDFSKQRRHSFIDDLVKNKLNTFRGQTYESRQQFPNPPKYMNVYKKLQVNEKKIGAY